MLKTIEGNKGVAESALNCGLDVVAAYPITPSTSIVEQLATYHSEGLLKCFIPVESEFSAISALVGASAAGARTFTGTSSQGLLLMHEVLFNASGMRLPIVLAVANRAVGAPLSIWNDSQDTLAQRDAGWMQFYARTNQEAADLVPIAFRVAEQVGLPAMVCLDGFFLTHTIEQVDVPSKEDVAKFLPPYDPKVKLDPENPLSLGVYATPPYYEEFRKDLEGDMQASLTVFEGACREFERVFGRRYGAIEQYKLEDATIVFVGLGGMMANCMEVVNELRAKGEKVGALYLRSYRPFPREAVRKALQGKDAAVIEKDISPGGAPGIYAEVIEACFGSDARVSSYTGGLGGREIGRKEFSALYERMKKAAATKSSVREWI